MKPDKDIDGFADTQIASGDTSEHTPKVSGGASGDAPADATGPTELRGRPGSIVDDHTLPDPAARTAGPGIRAMPAGAQAEDEHGRYQLLGEHARGGLGRIVKARDQQLGRTVAVKELLSSSRAAESLFVREALITARLEHPGIVPVHEAGRWPSGVPFYVMKLVSGQPLQTLLRQKTSLAERLPLLPNAIAVVETIAYAHSQGIIHRDIKPANVMVGEFGETVVVDWGLARYVEQPAGANGSIRGDGDPAQDARGERRRSGRISTWQTPDNYSVSGKVVGTPAYMAPEQARGEAVDERADVYALGALLYELLAGKPPYSGARDIISEVLAGPPQPLGEHVERASSGEPCERIPPDLIAIVDKAMARDPAARYRTAKELAEDLKRFQTGQLVSAHQYSAWMLLRRWLWRHRSPVLVALAGILALTVIGVISVSQVIEERNRAEMERGHARDAQRQAERDRNELVLLQAESALERDPTATLAWLKHAPIDGEWFATARNLYDEAMARGVARHVIDHDGWVTDAVFLPGGKRMVSAAHDGTVRLIDVTNGAQRILARTQQSLWNIALSADGAWLASGSETGTIFVWRLIQGKQAEPVHVLDGHAGILSELRFAPSGRLLSIAGDGSARVWDMASGTQIALFAVDGTAAFVPDGSRIVLSRRSREVVLLDVATGAVLWSVALPRYARMLDVSPDGMRVAAKNLIGEVSLLDIRTGAATVLGNMGESDTLMFPLLAFSPQGRWLVTADKSRAIHAWDLSSGERRILRGHESNIFNVAFSADEQILVSASDDGTARLWDLASSHMQVLRGHTDDVWQVRINPASDLVATVSVDGSIRLWPLRPPSGKRLSGHRSWVATVRFVDADTLLSTDDAGEIRTWSLSSEQSRVIGRTSMSQLLGEAAVSPDRRFVALPLSDVPALALWDLATGKERLLERGDGSGNGSGDGNGDDSKDGARLRRVAFAPDGKSIATADVDGKVVLWPLDGAPEVLRSGSRVCALTWSPHGPWLVVSTAATAEIWDMSRRARVADLELPGAMGTCMPENRTLAAFSPDSTWVALAGTHHDVLLWNLQTRTAGHLLDTQGYFTSGMAFSPDGSFLAAGSNERVVHLWDTATGKDQRLGRHGDMVTRLAFAPDGRTLATASYDNSVRLWDLTVAGAYRTLRGHTGSITTLDFSADGALLATGSEDHTVRIWYIHSDAIPDAAALRARVAGSTSAEIGSGGQRMHTP